ncbi:LamG domain-containing protein [Labilibaculum antarcticum]|uniref:Glycosyl hydrolase n=1 Tax=Labilibaculum antarcticum TaxID=1717717 RepID=A0A1Y1CM42_9BACT|nr:glycosyl hydrolase [Labilibaculum antarcticum]BAX81093.1 glycosyl hydrolase [Labilibaculum antarcticum]
MKRILAIIVFVISVTASFAQPSFKKGNDPKPADIKWVAVEELSDEFEHKNMDVDKWQINPIGNDWGWDGRPPGLFRAENVSIKNGKMCVTVGKLDAPVTKNGKTFTHQGGIVRSIKPGNVGMYFECKMKANATVMSSTFWLMTKYDCDKKLETDIQECVGRTTDKTDKWAQGWDSIFHSNAIHRSTPCVEKLQLQNATKLKEPNYSRYFIYAAWWKSAEEIQFFLDGEYQYSINPKVEWDMPAFIHMAIETYSWNPIPDDGGLVESGTWEQRTTQYEWIRTWTLQ